MEKRQLECARRLIGIIQEYKGVKVTAGVGKFLYDQWHRREDSKIEDEVAARLKEEYHKSMPYDHNGWYGNTCLQGLMDYMGASVLSENEINKMMKRAGVNE